jgi:hypothetical protein
VKIGEVVDARKNVIKADEAWELFQDADSLHVGKGKRTVVFSPDSASQEEILKSSLGRTGNLRAPTLRVGKVFYIGYNDAMYKELMG